MTNFWEDDKIRLRALEPEDWEVFYHWNMHSDMPRHLDALWFPSSKKQQRDWAERTAGAKAEDDSVFLVIEDKAGHVVGLIEPHHCNRRVGNFSYGVGVRPEYQRRGFASAAIILLLKYFFWELRYQKVTVDIHSDNPGSVRLHERLGFQQEGRLRRVVYNYGRHADSFIYGMTREEFEARYGSPPVE